MTRALAAALILTSLASPERPVFRRADINLTTGVITGRVMVNGFAADQAEVYARAVHVMNGERRATWIGSRAVTNTDGYYRLVGLKPGHYVITAEPAVWDLGRRTNPMAAQQPTLHPSTTDLRAAPVVRVDAGAEINAIDVDCAIATALSISGHVVTSDGRHAVQPVVTVRSITPFGIVRTGRVVHGSMNANSTLNSFLIPGLPPGRYELTAQSDRRNTGEWARTEVTLDGRNIELVLTLEKGMAVSGRVVFRTHRATAIPDPRLLSVTIGGDANTITGFGLIAEPALSPDFTFSAAGLRPGRYGVQVQLPDTMAGSWAVESMEISDVREAMRCCWLFGVPFDVPVRGTPESVTIVLTDRPASLSGVATDRAGRPSSFGVVAIVPADRSAWVAGSSRLPVPIPPDLAGRYAFPSLPPGDYLLTVLSDVDLDMWRAGIWPDVDASKAVRVTIASGEQKTFNIAIGGPLSRPDQSQAAQPSRDVPRTGSLSGRVAVARPQQTLEDVRAFRVWTSAQGDRKLGGPPGGYQAQFDYGGEFTFPSLPEGDYVIAAVALDASGMRMPQAPTSPAATRASGAGSTFAGRTLPTFFPATPELAAAESVRVTPGGDVRGIDISLVSQPWSRVEGRVVDPSGQPSPYAQVEIRVASLPVELRSLLAPQRITPLADGSFAFMMPAGRYVVSARGSGVPISGGPNTSRHLWGQADVTVTGSDIKDVVIRLEEGATISGTMSFTGGEIQPSMNQADFSVGVIPEGNASGGIVAAGVNPDATFTIRGVAPGRYTVMAMAVFGDQRWWQERVIVDGREVIDRPLEVRAGQPRSVVKAHCGFRRQPGRHHQMAVTSSPEFHPATT